jgi:osmotically-inducible protein OsmY
MAAAFALGTITGLILSRLDQRRRNIARDKVAAAGRGVVQTAARQADYAAGVAKGAAHAATTPLRPAPEYDDVTLARKVESVLFRPADAPKGAISVGVVDGVVELRGKLDDEDKIAELDRAARKVEGVKDVRNLVHT